MYLLIKLGFVDELPGHKQSNETSPASVLHKFCVFTSCKLNLEILTFGF